ncbi:MAG TPA: hypothetical protein VFJ16_13845 [Longimicrobium sp.]|nr:hypothetical protein [Longimicrobium sp.]
MSISLWMVPVGLALRVVMGKERFEQWARSAEVRDRTTVTSERELARAIRKAGYDATRFGGMLKTHLKGEESFVFWELEDGAWVLVSGKADRRALIRQLAQAVEAAAGKPIFVDAHLAGRDRQSAASQPAEEETVRTIGPEVFPTNFRDGALLDATLRRHGVMAAHEPGGVLSASVGRSTLRFVPAEGGGPYRLEITNAGDLRALFQQVAVLDESYRRGVQEAAYKTLKERIAAQNLVIEQEEVLEDRSIVITLNVPG